MKTSMFGAIFLIAFALPSLATVVYDEGTNGDLSNNGLTPTAILFSAGSNQVFGTTGRAAGVIDRDYFTFAVPSGYELTSLSVLPGTTVGGAVSFIGLQAGPQFTLPTNAASATGILGYDLYAPTPGDILPAMATAGNGSSGFSPTGLGAGTYSVWIQDFSTGSFNYGFDFALTPTPEPGSLCVVGFVMISGLAARRRALASVK